MTESIGTRITQLRTAKGWSRYKLAKKSGLSFSYLTALEEDKHSPSLDVVAKIASGLEVTITELLLVDSSI